MFWFWLGTMEIFVVFGGCICQCCRSQKKNNLKNCLITYVRFPNIEVEFKDSFLEKTEI